MSDLPTYIERVPSKSGKSSYCKTVRRRTDERRYWQERFGLSDRQLRRLTPAMMENLRHCEDDGARRLLLGIRSCD